MKLIAVGDNVADCYIDEKVFYPGGNAVNVAVNCKKNGADFVSYIGIFGDDDKAAWIQHCLELEGVDFSRSRKVYAHSGQPQVCLEKGDRVFRPGKRDSCQHLFRICLTQEDMDLIKKYDLCHTSCYSNIEYELPTLAKLCQVSFDFSDNFQPDYLEKVCPYLTYVFFSGSHLDLHQCQDLLKHAFTLGTKISGVTMGAKGALFYDGKDFYSQPVIKVEAIDTMGAGDSFIAGFLTKYTDSKNMQDSLTYAAQKAALTCTIHGGFGHPHPLKD